MVSCCAKGCPNRNKDSKRFFRLPLGKNDGRRLKAWLEIAGRADKQPSGNLRLCEDHFAADQFESSRADGRKLLKPFAIPTIAASDTTNIPQQSSSLKNTGETAITAEDAAGCAVEEAMLEGDEGRVDGLQEQSLPAVPDSSWVSGDAFSSWEGGSVLQASTECGAYTCRHTRHCTIAPTSQDNEETAQDLRHQLTIANQKVQRLKDELEACRGPTTVAGGQLASPSNPDAKANRWSDSAVKRALKIRLACGRRGYQYLQSEVAELSLPSEGTLLRRIEGMRFRPGLLEDLLPALECKIASMDCQERHCVLLLDHIQLTPGLDFDMNTREVIGQTTIVANATSSKKPGQSSDDPPPFATRGLVFMLAGLATRWKQIIGYHFSGDSASATALKDVVFDIIRRCEALGLSVDGVASDMGPCNPVLWKACGISAPRIGSPCVSCPHPCVTDGGRKLYFMADAPHILKSITAHLVKCQKFLLPQGVVKKHSLPTAEVSVRYVKEMAELDGSLDLRIAPRLKMKHLDPKHCEKLTVSSALAVFNREVAAGIKLLVSMGAMNKDALTTSWFLEQVHKWLSLMVTRRFSTNSDKQAKHDEAAQFMEDFMELFRHLTIRGPNQRDSFKPVQAGVLISTTSALKLQEMLRKEHGFRFVLLSRLPQDALENLFSTVRLRSPVPRALEFKSALRMITLCQFFNPNCSGNYVVDDSVQLLDFTSCNPASLCNEVENDDPLDIHGIGHTRY